MLHILLAVTRFAINQAKNDTFHEVKYWLEDGRGDMATTIYTIQRS